MKRLTLIMVIICFVALATAAYAADEAQAPAKPKVQKIDLGDEPEGPADYEYGEDTGEYESADDVRDFGDPMDTVNESPMGKVPQEE